MKEPGKTAEVYNFASEEFINTFTKLAADMGATPSEVNKQLDVMQANGTPPPLNDKEQRVYNKLQHVPGLVLAHGLGTGKTRTSIQVANHLNQPTDVVVPAALQANYKKEMDKWLGGRQHRAD